MFLVVNHSAGAKDVVHTRTRARAHTHTHIHTRSGVEFYSQMYARICRWQWSWCVCVRERECVVVCVYFSAYAHSCAPLHTHTHTHTLGLWLSWCSLFNKKKTAQLREQSRGFVVGPLWTPVKWSSKSSKEAEAGKEEEVCLQWGWGSWASGEQWGSCCDRVKQVFEL